MYQKYLNLWLTLRILLQKNKHTCQVATKMLHIYYSTHFSGGSKEMQSREDIEAFRKETNASSVMIARAAEWNCSIFRKEGRLRLVDVIPAYLRYAVDYDNADGNTKYCVQNMLKDWQDTPLGKLFHQAQTNEQIWCVIDSFFFFCIYITIISGPAEIC